jgi:hypothetical protein
MNAALEAYLSDPQLLISSKKMRPFGDFGTEWRKLSHRVWKNFCKIFVRFLYVKLSQAGFFLGTKYQNGKYITNGHKIYLWLTLLRVTLNLTLATRGEFCPLGGVLTPLFTPRREHSLLFRRMKGLTDNFTPKGQNSPLGTTSPRG